MEGEKEDGTSSGKKYALLAAKRKATMDTTVRRYVNCLVTAYMSNFICLPSFQHFRT